MRLLLLTLFLIIILLLIYVIVLQAQLSRINKQLEKRLIKLTRQPIDLELINKELNQLVCNINKCLKAEETLRLESYREEKYFKELIANISHDLRTPLTAVKGYQQLLEKSGLTPEQTSRLKTAQKHTDNLGRLIEVFFEYSYLVNAEAEPVMEKVDAAKLVAECLGGMVNELEARNISVRFNCPETLVLITDKEMVTRMVQNLIMNSVHHSFGNLEVTLSKLTDSVRICFKNPVKDPGSIDPNRLFDRFYTAERSRSKTTGLGLSIVKLLAEHLHGSSYAQLDGNDLIITISLPLP